MTAFFDFFVEMWTEIINTLNSAYFEFYGYRVNLFAILFALFVVGFVITVYWRGSKT